ncbi:Bug family tripartite tricarboxylate transporter substrate binding protein [Comamonas endophytica]|uniref:Bug family tripartite tricarboxylate transporter substrate binding protein n=1 Tax=Comamonas endophytica TaxID=2949090 RepID=UPI0036089517
MALCALHAAVPSLAASEFPSQPVKITVPFPPGGSADVFARIVGDGLSRKWGQAVVIENKPGAGGVVATGAVVRMPADGHHLMVVTVGHAINPHLYAKLPYDTTKDLTAIAKLATMPSLLVVNPRRVPVQSVQELVAKAREASGQQTYASSGNASTSHVAAALFNTTAGIETTHIPYKGSAPAMTDLLSGHVDWMIDPLATALPHVKAGKLNALAITTRERSPLAPDIPTMQEAGVKGYDFSSWFLMLGPQGIPAPVVKRINEDVAAVLKEEAVQRRFAELGAEAGSGTPQAINAFLGQEIQRYGALVKQAGMKVE